MAGEARGRRGSANAPRNLSSSRLIRRTTQPSTTETRGRFADLLFANDAGPALKWQHYPAIYDRLLGEYVGSSARILEIGVYRGGSQSIWRKFFGPNVTLFGIDIDPLCAAYDGKAGSVRIGSQADPEFLKRPCAKWAGSIL